MTTVPASITEHRNGIHLETKSAIDSRRNGLVSECPKPELGSWGEMNPNDTHVDISNPAVLYTALKLNPMIVAMTNAEARPHNGKSTSGMKGR